MVVCGFVQNLSGGMLDGYTAKDPNIFHVLPQKDKTAKRQAHEDPGDITISRDGLRKTWVNYFQVMADVRSPDRAPSSAPPIFCGSSHDGRKLERSCVRSSVPRMMVL